MSKTKWYAKPIRRCELKLRAKRRGSVAIFLALALALSLGIVAVPMAGTVSADDLFEAPQDYGVGDGPYFVTTGDFDSDGKIDLATANYNSDDVSILLGNGDGSFQAPVNYGAGDGPYSATTGDFDGDGKLDLAVANSPSHSISILLGNGDGTFQAAVDYDSGPTRSYSVTTGDFNGNGNLDLAVANWGIDAKVSILLGNGDGTFQAAVDYDAGNCPYWVTTGDFDADGKLDLAVANMMSDDVSILLGNGDGTFQAPVNYGYKSDQPRFVTTGDFNANGKMDLATANYNSDDVSILLGNGDGSFQAPVKYGYKSDAAISIATGDFNGDGETDLAVAVEYAHNVAILLGNGDGSFQAPDNYDVGDRLNSITAGDFNADGKLDLAVACWGSDKVYIFLAPPPTEVWVDDDDATCGGNSPCFATISEGVNAVAESGTVNVAAGTYNENIDVNKQVTIIGAGEANTIVTAANNMDHVFEVTADGVSISNLTATGANYPAYGWKEKSGIYIDDADGCTVDSVTAEGNNVGIYLKDSQGSTVTSCTATNNINGIWLEDSHGNIISGNDANSNVADDSTWAYTQSWTGLGIYLELSSNNQLTGNTANWNKGGSEYSGIGIYLDRCPVEVWNWIDDHWEITYLSPNVLTGNTANENEGLRDYDYSGVGILIWQSGGTSDNKALLSGNTANGNTYAGTTREKSGSGIVLYQTHYADVIGSTVNGNQRNGFYSEGAIGNFVHDNIVTGNTATGNNIGFYLVNDASTYTSNTITGNTDDGVRLDYYGGMSVTATALNYNNISGNGNYGANNIGIGTDILNAEKNWWGDATGPAHVSNPHTAPLGDAVSDNVDFTPWYATATTTPGTENVSVEHSPIIAYSDTIQGGIDAALAGDTVNVEAGTYDLTAPIAVDKELTITGDTTTPSNVVVNAPTGATDMDCFQVKANSITIQGFKIQGAKDVASGNGWQNAGIMLGNDPARTLMEDATSYIGVQYTTISHNEITDCSVGIYHYRAQHTTISSNKIYGCTIDGGRWTGKGIQLYGEGSGAQDYDIDILNNEIYNNELMGIELNYEDVDSAVTVDVLIDSNKIYNNGGGMDAIGPTVDFYRGISSNKYSNGVTITNNEIYGHVAGTGSRFYGGCAGIRADGNTQDWEISDNDIRDNFRGVYSQSGSTGFVITGNDVYDNAQGITVGSGTVGLAYNNDIYDNDVNTWAGLTCPYGHGVGDPYGCYNFGTGTFDATNNWWGDASGPDDDAGVINGSGDKISTNVGAAPWADGLRAFSGTPQSGAVGTTLALPFVAQLKNTADADTSINGVPVTYNIAGFPAGATGQSLSVEHTATDSSGQASSTLTFGNKVGTYTVTANVPRESTATFTATATPGSLDHIVISPGTATITAGDTQAYSAEDFDQYNNSLGDVTSDTTFEIQAGAGGSWAANVYTSENVGTWTVTGTYNDKSDTATLTVNPAALHTVTLTAAPINIPADGSSISVLTATVKDQYGNNVADGTDVVFDTNYGTLGSSTVTKQTSDGVATATLTSELSTETVIATVTATANGVSDAAAVFFIVEGGAEAEESEIETVIGSGTIEDTATGGDVTIDADPGTTHTITTAKYEDNPGGIPTFEATGDYYDIHLDNVTGVNSLTIDFCPAEPDTVIYYWDGIDWSAASDQSYSDGCVKVTVTSSTFPRLSDLTGLVFASGTPPPPPPPVGGEAYPVNKLAILAPWIALAAAIIAGATIFMRRRRVES